MCMGGPGCGGNTSSGKSSGGYTPKKFSGSAKATPKARGSFRASGSSANGNGYGKPTVRFSGRNR